MDRGFDAVADRLRIPPPERTLCVDWDDAMRAREPDVGRFLEPGYIVWAGRAVGLTEAMIRDLLSFAGRYAEEDDVVAFFAYCRHRVLHDATMVESWEAPWPSLDDRLGEEAGLLSALVMLSAVPEMEDTYRRLGIPADVARDTVSDLRLWMDTDLYALRFQRCGITPWIARWLCKHWQGKVLRLGRLQFSRCRFEGGVRAFRSRSTGVLAVLSEPGIRYRADGEVPCALCRGTTGEWTSRLTLAPEGAAGHPVLPGGKAMPWIRRLPSDEWAEALAPGDEMLMFHIPTGEPLAFDACGASFRKALDFFPRHFPDQPFRGFWTRSWLLDPRWSSLLPATSNIVRLQRALQLFPGIQGDDRQILQRVFGWDAKDCHAVPWETTLQKAAGRYFDEGGHFHGGFGFVLNEDLPRTREAGRP